MVEIIATRPLQYSAKGHPERHDIEIRIHAPFEVQEGSVNFDIGDGVSACRWEVVGLPEKFEHVIYGIDTLQALQLALDTDPIVRALEKRYDLFWASGEPYFED